MRPAQTRHDESNGGFRWQRTGTASSAGREVVIVEAVRTPIGRGHEEKGYYKDVHASNLLAKAYAELIERAGIDPAEVEDVVAGCVQQFGEQGDQHRPQRLARGRPADRDAGDHGRPPVRLRPAGGQLRRGAGRLRRPRRRRRRRRRAHGPHLLRRLRLGDGGARLRLLAAAARALQPRAAGDLRRDDRRQVGDPPLRARRNRPALAPARRQGDRGGPLRARDRPLPGQRRHLRDRPGHPPRHLARGALAAEAGLQGGRQDHRRQLLAGLRRRRRACC